MELSLFNQILSKHALLQGQFIALESHSITLTYAQLQEEVGRLSKVLASQDKGCRIAMAVSNHPAWVVVDIAALGKELPLVPIPSFFSDSQILHALTDAGANTFVTDEPDRFSLLLETFIIKKSNLTVAGKILTILDINVSHVALPFGTSKITYTSGTTGAPKGVCLTALSMLNVANSIVESTNIDSDSQHLCVLPLSTLLENVAGVYAALIAGATIHLLSCEEIGFYGSQLHIHRLHQALLKVKANTTILIPELLKALIATIEAGAPKLPDLNFLAVGGAAVSTELLERANALSLPVYQGYGLSECASVVSLNTRLFNKLGSVGRVLLHNEIKIEHDNEILVKGARFIGYTGTHQAESNQAWFHTGDIGEIDKDGYLFIKGRKKNIFITSFGRNISPEWVESSLLNSSNILQVCVYGEAKPWNIALIVTTPNVSLMDLNKDIEAVNQLLPDYARITKWAAVEPFTHANQQLTLNGRLKRQEIHIAHQKTIQNLYKEIS